jgi:hypothetical protein
VISAARFRTLCLALEGTSAAPHFDRTAFRARKIFATLPPDGLSANLLLVPELQSAIVEGMPHAFTPVPGGWGRMGYTTVDLAKVTEAELVPVLRESHALASEPPRRGASTKPKSAASKPKSAASKPKSAASKPKSAASKPKSAASKPKSAASKPKSAASKKAVSRGRSAR